MNHASEDASLKTMCTQIIISLKQIDPELLEQGVGKLDFKRKTPVRKVMIEYENQQVKGKNFQVITAFDKVGGGGSTAPPNFIANSGERQSSPEQSFRDTQ
jgi:hypothetical protein